ncbi:MAG: Holliday junction branch migration protein RuvA [Peptococcaceae bacterium]|nr:Holliday junction branch migration protein RuvA [Peptococcaceae bacterium]
MIAFLRGNLHAVNGDSVIVDVNGVGYLVQVPLSLVPGLPSPGSEVMLHTFMAVREDGVSLYGFDTVEALEVFRLLLNVNGVGPRGALSLLSVITPGGLAAAVSEENAGLLSKAPGIGKKIAQRIILELKDKFTAGQHFTAVAADPGGPAGNSRDAVEALVSLGFAPPLAAQAVGRAARELGPEAPVAGIVRHALRQLADRK